MTYEKPQVEVIRFDSGKFFMAWSANEGVDAGNVMNFLFEKYGVTPDQITGGGTDALQINQSTHTVICSYYSGCYGHQFQW